MVAVLALAAVLLEPAGVVPGHSHNDYTRPRPLQDALDAKLRSVEADVFLVDGELRVAHTRAEIRPERTLESLYLAPLRQIVQRQGHVYPSTPLILLVDIKAEGEAAYRHLVGLLRAYPDLVGSPAKRPVHVIVSGDRPLATLRQDAGQWAGIDGRTRDLDATDPAPILPLISDAFPTVLTWRGAGEMPEPDRTKLRHMVSQAHAKGRLFRLWAAPDHERSWNAQWDAGVDLVNTDRPADLAAAWRQRSRTGQSSALSPLAR